MNNDNNLFSLFILFSHIGEFYSNLDFLSINRSAIRYNII